MHATRESAVAAARPEHTYVHHVVSHGGAAHWITTRLPHAVLVRATEVSVVEGVYEVIDTWALTPEAQETLVGDAVARLGE